MTHFGRALFVTLAAIILVLTAVLAFELINESISKSGFSSGEVLVFQYEEGVFSGEIMGREFSADISPLLGALPVLENFALLLSPCSQLLLRFLILMF
ncbi:MAG: hypothetical protein IJ306_03780 [Oscillospiraceae bacterium]|nr:hypothetical protein [Oscillospiraceae bacterium]